MSDFYRKCSSCKKEIAWNTRHWVCSVSSCHRVGRELVFCTVSCFDAHVPVMNHKNAGAVERRSPAHAQAKDPNRPLFEKPANTAQGPKNDAKAAWIDELLGNPPANNQSATEAAKLAAPDEIWVVVSKVKAYIKDRSGMNTSDSVMKLLTQKLYIDIERSIRSARQNGRKTVLDRDF